MILANLIFYFTQFEWPLNLILSYQYVIKYWWPPYFADLESADGDLILLKNFVYAYITMKRNNKCKEKKQKNLR